MISNPAGHLGSLPQGGPGQGYLPQGGGVWSPFKVGRPIVLLDAAKGLTFNGSGADLIDEDFASDPSWNETGTNAIVQNGRVEIPLNDTVETNSFFWLAYASQTEVWCVFDWTIGADTVLPGGTVIGSGLGVSSGNACLNLGLTQSGGLKFATHHRNDSGVPGTVISSPLPSVGTKYTITCHYKAATAPAADDGIAQVWIDKELVLDLNNVDSDTITIESGRAGYSSINTSALGLQFIDNFKVGTTGASPAQVSNELDQSGNAVDLSQPTAVDQPLIITADSDFNNNPSILGDGVSEHLFSELSAFTVTLPFTTIIVYKAEVLGTSNIIFDQRSGLWTLFSTPGNVLNMNAGVTQAIGTLDLNPHIRVIVWNGASTKSWEDGISNDPAASPGTILPTSLRFFVNGGLGAFGNNKYAYFDMYDFELSAVQLNYICNGLGARFGLAWADI